MKTNFMLNSLSGKVKKTQKGFSLVEVVLAVGIMAMGVVTILGLLPHGMEMSRKTANEQAETRIVEQLVGEMQSADWTTMGGLIGGGSEIKAYFDDQGLRLLNAESSVGSGLVYMARVLIVNNSEIDQGAPLPGKNNNAVNNKNLRRVTIEVAATQNPLFDFDNPPPAVQVKRYTQLIGKMRN